MEILVFLYGIIIGSFLNVCIYRIPREESIIFKSSHCTNCDYKLRVIDLFPVFSYMILGGKCRNCKEKISIKYPIIELLNGIMYVVLFINFGFSMVFIKYCFFTSLMIVIGVIDFETTFVYRVVTVVGFIAGIFLTIIQSINNKNIVLDSMVGFVVSTIILLLIVIITKGMGEGDIEIAAICGMFLGIKGVFVTLFLSFVICGIVSSVILLLKLKDKKDVIAFGPYLAVAGMISMIYGGNLIDLYMKNFF